MNRRRSDDVNDTPFASLFVASSVRALSLSIVILLVALWAIAAKAQGGTPPLRKYAGSPDYPALLKEPQVKANLQAVVGRQLPTLMRNLNVAGDIGLVSGALSISGNAPHKGGEEEGVICVSEYDGKVEAAIYSKGRVSVFAKDKNYEFLMLCIKDWITQVNSGHRDRFKQPANVQFGKPN
jgi:hypothetical protein